MAKTVIQASFNSGEWAPALYGRVDLQKYHSGAALLKNFYVDYRGGATACPGSKYIIPTWNSAGARLIPFQVSFSQNFALVFENARLWFINNGAPVLETAQSITAVTQANPGVFTIAGHGFATDDRVFLNDLGGMSSLNGYYYYVSVIGPNTFSLRDIFNHAVDTSALPAYSGGGTAARIYTVATIYSTAELFGIKYAQDVNVMFLCHPNRPLYTLTYTSLTNWTLVPATIGSAVAAPTGQAVATTLAAGTWNYAYVITAVDANGDESGPSAFATLANVQDLRAIAGTNTITWNAVTNAVSYNVYKSELRSAAAVPAGSMFGYIGNCTALTFIDSNIAPDFSQNYPIVKNPFSGSGVQSINVTAPGNYVGATVPDVSFTGGGGGTGAAAIATVGCIAATVAAGGIGYSVGSIVYSVYGMVFRVTAVLGSAATAVAIVNPGSISAGALSANPYATWHAGSGLQLNVTMGVISVGITSPGIGYGPAPGVAFSSGAAAATATLGAPSAGNPTVPQLFQQRLTLMGPVANPRQFNMSQPGTYYNFNVTDPVQPDNAFQGYLVSGTLNTIHSAISQPQGLLVLSDQGAWLINNGQAGTGVDAINATANAQIFSGASGPPPITAGEDVLYVQSKGSIVRNVTFNWNKQIYGGADITVQSSHLFYGFQILDWAWAEEPYKLVWAIRNDGQMNVCTFSKEQELIAWGHRITEGAYQSVATIAETVDLGTVNAVYTIVRRTISGVTFLFIERFMEQFYPNGAIDSWQLDSGLNYTGVAAISFSGALHLVAEVCSAVAEDDEGVFYTFDNITIAADGTYDLPAPTAPATGYTTVTIGLPFTPQLKTLPIDTGDPSIQGRMKFLPEVTVRVNQTLGLEIGTDEDNLVPMDDLVIGNIGKDTNEVITAADMVSGDAVQALDSRWTTNGQYLIQQSSPLPASILAVIPKIEIGKE
jgi:hypothetical protein